VTTPLYLIAHSVRGEAAFDVALQMECPFCQSYESVTGQWCEAEREQEDCFDCEALGYWWIIPTAGHRAFPYWSRELGELTNGEIHAIDGMPPGWPDHYKTDATVPEVDIKTLFKKSQLTMNLNDGTTRSPLKYIERKL
jgi:hypothetical protein